MTTHTPAYEEPLPLSYRDPGARKITESVEASVAATNAAAGSDCDETDADYFADRAAEAARFAISAHATAALVYAGREGKPTSVAISASARGESRATGAVISAEAAAEASAAHAAALFSNLAEVHKGHVGDLGHNIQELHHWLRVGGKLRIFEQRVFRYGEVSEKLIDILRDHEGAEHEESEVDFEWRARALATAVVEGNAAAAANHVATMFSGVATMHCDRLIEIGSDELNRPFRNPVRRSDVAGKRVADIARAQAKSRYAFQRSSVAKGIQAAAKYAAVRIKERGRDGEG